MQHTPFSMKATFQEAIDQGFVEKILHESWYPPVVLASAHWPMIRDPESQILEIGRGRSAFSQLNLARPILSVMSVSANKSAESLAAAVREPSRSFLECGLLQGLGEVQHLGA